jgi:O-acetyl-ADP-ribose deacetylase (regulator of RNase III)
VAIRTVASFLSGPAATVKEVVFVLFDPVTYQAYSSALEELA